MFGLSAGPVAAAPPDPPSRTDLVAEALAEDPVQVTDHEARLVDPDAIRADLKTALDPLGVPYYVVVTPQHIFLDEYASPGEFIPILHDRLRKDGLYVVTDTTGSGEARMYGSALPAQDAWRATRRELPYGTNLVEHFVRFAEMLSAPDPAARVAAATRAPEYESASDDRDRVEMTALAVGTAAGALLVGVAILLNRALKSRNKGSARGRAPQKAAGAPRANTSRKGKSAQAARRKGRKGGRR
ncbi:hypothetical protein [Actinocorallia herbida]|uniref:hypothetical protein n=1 Tax=Actinocorallia herbida TaxID=58109 RepID=UPI000F4B6F94|nr:hypothetical protein [Actinocorallia herbida]